MVPYDRGLATVSSTGEISGISPSEASSVIRVSAAGVVEYVDINCAVVTPRAPSAGYQPPQLAGGIEHQGPGTGHIEVELLDADALQDNATYEVIFHDTSAFALNRQAAFDCINTTSQTALLEGEQLEEGLGITPVVEGMVVHVSGDTACQVIEAETGWVKGAHSWGFRVGKNPSLSGRFVPYPADFEISFYDHIVDTSLALLFGQTATPVHFMIYNATEARTMDFLFGDKDKDGLFSPGDSVTIVVGLRLGEPLPTPRSKFKTAWTFFYDQAAGGSDRPASGDIFRARTSKPFRDGETFRFTIQGARESVSQASERLSGITVVPNPYCAAASWEPRNPFRFGRGERRIFFNHLPARCTIRIYTVRGYLVNTIEHDSSLDDGSESWDLVSKDGMDIAYGVYLFQVDAPGVGTHIDKFAVIK